MRPRFDPLPHLDDMGRYARVLTGNDADAQELVQEALVRALAVADTCDLSRPLLPWLIKIVRNAHLTGVARRNVESRSLADIAILHGSEEMPSQEHHADLNRVQRAIETLPTEHAEVLQLVGALGFSYAESANILAIPTGTLMSRLSRARTALKRALEAPASQAPVLRVIGGKGL
jgi:RNA polymerase sigma-70 factor (ECF subfamily)